MLLEDATARARKEAHCLSFPYSFSDTQGGRLLERHFTLEGGEDRAEVIMLMFNILIIKLRRKSLASECIALP